MNTGNRQKRIFYFDREKQSIEEEYVLGLSWILLLYPSSPFFYWLSKTFLLPVLRLSFISHFYGFLQRLPSSRKKIRPFVESQNIESKDFVKSLEDFTSFDDFFTRKLKSSARPVAQEKEVAVAVADGRYLAYPQITSDLKLEIKNQHLNIKELLNDADLAEEYKEGSLVIARLCPLDYHRFHFPFDCEVSSPKLINGHLLSVNPIALAKNVHIFSENKRYLTKLQSPLFQDVIFLEIGATNVGSVHHSSTTQSSYKKGEEKGFFSFGGSCIILLFKKDSIKLDDDLVKSTLQGTEVLCKMGQTIGKQVIKQK
jgi:phosphatidylserine decarboxylase